MPKLSLPSPLGPLVVVETAGALTRIDWGEGEPIAATPLLREAKRQLEAYFARRLTRFELPLAPSGTAFQHLVWRLMAKIPYGATRSYGELAATLGTAPRAVGGACRANPIPIVVPCHRVLAAGGRLGGYSGFDKLDSKRFLLALEGAPPVTA